MGFIKKNLTFTIILVVCILAFAAGVYLVFVEAGKIDQRKQKDTTRSQEQDYGTHWSWIHDTERNVE